LCALALLAAPAHAQLAGGNLYGVVQDESGAALPGANVAIAGPGITQSFTAGADGRFRFLNVPPGGYKITVSLTGFTTVVRENVLVTVGANTDIPVALKVAQVEETITVTAESPVLDTKKTGTGTNFTQDELLKIPNSRDPWALLRSVPGIIMDRVNIAGNESGQQSNFAGKGSLRTDAVWAMDGVNITDMAALGASPTYFDYDAFEEINISTGANDIRQQTGGVGLNFVTKRGTNTLHGTVRGYFNHEDLGWSNVPDELANPRAEYRAAGIRPVTADTANHNKQIADYGLDLGGPIIKDKLWFWGSWGKQDIRLVRSAGAFIDKTLLIDYNVKVNFQATSKDMLSVMWFRGAKQKFGRATGNCAGCVTPSSSTWNQDDYYPEEGGPFNLGLPGLWKIEDNHVFNPNLFVSVKYAYYGTGFKLESEGDPTQQAGDSERLGQAFGSVQSLYFLRPQHTANLDGSWFVNGFGGNNEVKFGVAWRQADGDSQTIWPGNMIRALDISPTNQRARIYREGNSKNRAKYLSFYLGDTYTRDRLTLNVGVRFDSQNGFAGQSDTLSNPAFPNLVPGIQFAGYDTPFTWSDVTPRVGLTYALDASRKTLLRASYSRYASQLGVGEVGYVNPTGAAGFVDYRWTDLNGDHFVQPNEINFAAGSIGSGGGFNPANPTAVSSPSRLDPSLSAPLADEIIAGIDRELAGNFAVSVSYTFRRNTRQEAETAIGLTLADYTPSATQVSGATPYIGQTFPNVTIFIPNDAKARAAGNGRLLTNRAGYNQSYHGIEFAAIKRLSNKWMGRVAASVFNHSETFDGTPSNFAYFGNPTRIDIDPLVEGGEVPIRSAGSGAGDVFYNAKWAVNVNALYQLPGDFDISANLFGRQASAFPVFRNGSLGFQGTFRVITSPEVDTLRLDDIWNLDLRLSKTIRAGRTNMTLTADLFNVFNNSFVINRNRNAGSALFNYVTDNLSPRTARFGVRLGF
jgi:hypothetical protein